mgnify:CR=1 FL=1
MIIRDRQIGGYNDPTYIVAELGINHQGDIGIAKQLIEAAARAGANAVKIQKRVPRVSTPKSEWDKLRETPWGSLTYIQYRERIELSIEQVYDLKWYARRLGLDFISSVWDRESLRDVIELLDAIKIPSAMLTNRLLITDAALQPQPTILSTGMSTTEQIWDAVFEYRSWSENQLAILHCTSTYPCSAEELNLLLVRTLQEQYPDLVIGYSNHSPGIIAAVTAVALGAKIVEAHITLDRTMWGTDHAASIEPAGFARMISYIRTTELSLGNGIKMIYESELPNLRKLRGVT